MRSSYLVVLVMALSVAGVYWYQSSASVCPVPLSYRLGDIDESFNLSTSEALLYVEEAESLWEKAVNRELFVYDESSDFVIDFIFDERQESANSEEYQREALDEQRAKNESVFETVESLQEEYRNLSDTYKARASKYEANLAEYNSEVNLYNDRGGAPPDVFEALEAERRALSNESDSLSKIVVELNSLAKEINRLGERSAELVDDYNQEVKHYNAEFGFAREFTQGDYQGKRISIYKYSSDEELITVLAHEFGHALGIDHVEGSSSLMYYLLEDTNLSPTFSDEDMAAYIAVCGVAETTGQKLRRTIRTFLAKL